MPDVTGGGIGLNEAELAATIAYLQDSGGAEVTVALPAMPAPGAEAPKAEEAAPLKTPEEVIAKYTAGAGHKVAGQEGALGPDLTKIGKTKSKDYLRQAILDPEAVIAKGFTGGMIPPPFGVQLKSQAL